MTPPSSPRSRASHGRPPAPRSPSRCGKYAVQTATRRNRRSQSPSRCATRSDRRIPRTPISRTAARRLSVSWHALPVRHRRCSARPEAADTPSQGEDWAVHGAAGSPEESPIRAFSVVPARPARSRMADREPRSSVPRTRLGSPARRVPRQTPVRLVRPARRTDRRRRCRCRESQPRPNRPARPAKPTRSECRLGGGDDSIPRARLSCRIPLAPSAP